MNELMKMHKGLSVQMNVRQIEQMKSRQVNMKTQFSDFAISLRCNAVDILETLSEN